MLIERSALASPLPGFWQKSLTPRLGSDENVLAWLEVDLDGKLHFSRGLLLLTNKNLLTCRKSTVDGDGGWESWPLRSDLHLAHADHAGVGCLELTDASVRLAVWRFTLGQNVAAIALLDAFERLVESIRTGLPPAVREENVCSNCKAVLEPGQDECPVCTREIHTPSSTWTLLRLWRFARPYNGQLLAGFLLTLAATAANMVPPYLSMPLMDDVLIPYQNGVPINVMLVGKLLAGLFAAAVAAWALSWAKTYILALVSERIGADLRTTTYEHLMRLSLEYFGGKRTGDLMSRIGSESDRICVFLSLHLLDFATDVLMIVMTAVILFIINPWLAVVTFLPLPFIAWMIHVVRDRLRTGFEKIDRVWSEVTNVLADTIPGIRVVKAFAQEERETVRFRQANQHNLAVNDRLNKTWSVFSPTVSLLTEIGLLVVWGFGIWQVSKSQITVGVLTAFLAYIGRFYTRLDSMSRIVSVTQKAASGAKRIFDILDHFSSVPEPVVPVHLTSV